MRPSLNNKSVILRRYRKGKRTGLRDGTTKCKNCGINKTSFKENLFFRTTLAMSSYKIKSIKQLQTDAEILKKEIVYKKGRKMIKVVKRQPQKHKQSVISHADSGYLS